MDAGSRPPLLAADARALSLALTAGVLAVHALPTLPGTGTLAVLAAAVLLPFRTWRLLWGAAVLGVLLTVLQARHRLDERWPSARHGEEIEVAGDIASLVERVPAARPGTGTTLRFDFTPDDPRLPSRVRAAWYRSDAPVRAGDRWRLRLKMRTPHGSLDLGGSDYESWLYRQGIGATATVLDGTRLAERSGDRVLQARQAIVERLARWLPDRRAFAMAAALAVGDESGFSDADWEAFRKTGTSHLVAISGFNIAIVAAVAFALVRWAWASVPRLALALPAQKAAAAAGAAAGLLDALLAGWGAPAQRAALMLAALLVLLLTERRAHRWRGLALTWAAMLCADPSQVLAPGLWLSFGAVAAIYWVAGMRLGREPAWRTAIRLQLLLSVALVPLTLLHFQGASWPAPLVNLAAVPAMAVLTPALLGAMLAAWTVPPVGIPAIHLVGWALGALQSGAAWIAAVVPDLWLPSNPPAAALGLAAFGTVLLLAPRGLPTRIPGWLCLTPLLLPLRPPVEGAFELTVLDVGQGLAAVVRTPHHVLLYDAGPAYEEGFDAGASIVAPFLLRVSGRTLDRLMLSHGDLDHAGGVASVRQLLRVRDEIGTPGHRPCTDGTAWTWDGVRFDVLHPAPGEEGSANDGSCVLGIRSGPYSVLLAGDIERAAEQRLLREHADALQADVLVAPHHGSGSSSSPAFVAAVKPRMVVFSAGWRSRFGHPRADVVARYRAAGAEMHVTGVEGAIRIGRTRDGTLRSSGRRAEAARFWNAPPEP